MRHRFGPASRGSSSYHFKVMGWEGVWAGTHSASAASTATTATETGLRHVGLSAQDDVMSDPILPLAGRNRYEKKRVAKSPVPDPSRQSTHHRREERHPPLRHESHRLLRMRFVPFTGGYCVGAISTNRCRFASVQTNICSTTSSADSDQLPASAIKCV